MRPSVGLLTWSHWMLQAHAAASVIIFNILQAGTTVDPACLLQFKALKGLSLKESLAQFSSTMTAQTDLRVEAAHLRRFFRNFVPVRGSVTPPFPLPQFISESVLIETFEPGTQPWACKHPPWQHSSDACLDSKCTEIGPVWSFEPSATAGM